MTVILVRAEVASEVDGALVRVPSTQVRSEPLERIRRRLNDLHTAAVAAQGTTPYDAQRPFAHTWTKAREDVQWWKKEVDRKRVTSKTSDCAKRRC